MANVHTVSSLKKVLAELEDCGAGDEVICVSHHMYPLVAVALTDEEPIDTFRYRQSKEMQGIMLFSVEENH